MYDLLQLFGLAQQLANVKAYNMSMCCLCRLDLTADVESGSHDSVGQHDESARQHSLSGICCKALHSCFTLHSITKRQMTLFECDC